MLARKIVEGELTVNVDQLPRWCARRSAPGGVPPDRRPAGARRRRGRRAPAARDGVERWPARRGPGGDHGRPEPSSRGDCVVEGDWWRSTAASTRGWPSCAGPLAEHALEETDVSLLDVRRHRAGCWRPRSGGGLGPGHPGVGHHRRGGAAPGGGGHLVRDPRGGGQGDPRRGGGVRGAARPADAVRRGRGHRRGLRGPAPGQRRARSWWADAAGPGGQRGHGADRRAGPAGAARAGAPARRAAAGDGPPADRAAAGAGGPGARRLPHLRRGTAAGHHGRPGGRQERAAGHAGAQRRGRRDRGGAGRRTWPRGARVRRARPRARRACAVGGRGGDRRRAAAGARARGDGAPRRSPSTSASAARRCCCWSIRCRAWRWPSGRSVWRRASRPPRAGTRRRCSRLLPRLVERAGNDAGEGSITALYTRAGRGRRSHRAGVGRRPRRAGRPRRAVAQAGQRRATSRPSTCWPASAA